jgi:ornithine cyclodeaminase/alanine dehydrogenase-like protein (mu-crystallin family)
MAKFTVLGDAVIKSLLLDLSKEEIQLFQTELEDCLIAYSRGRERQYQPSPGIINRPDLRKVLFRPFTSPETVGTKIFVHPAPTSEASDSCREQIEGATPRKENQQLPPHGLVVLCDKSGNPTCFLNAEEVTGYRTSISAMIPYMMRRRTRNIIVFGAGRQALWHSRLALALRGPEIMSITIANRSEARAQELIQTLKEENQLRWRSPCTFSFLTSSQSAAEEELQFLLAEADVIFCTVPSQQPLFSLESLALDERQGRYPLISAVGSWQANMIEVDPASFDMSQQ